MEPPNWRRTRHTYDPFDCAAADTQSLIIITVFTFIHAFEAFELVYAMQGSEASLSARPIRWLYIFTAWLSALRRHGWNRFRLGLPWFCFLLLPVCPRSFCMWCAKVKWILIRRFTWFISQKNRVSSRNPVFDVQKDHETFFTLDSFHYCLYFRRDLPVSVFLMLISSLKSNAEIFAGPLGCQLRWRWGHTINYCNNFRILVISKIALSSVCLPFFLTLLSEPWPHFIWPPSISNEFALFFFFLMGMMIPIKLGIIPYFYSCAVYVSWIHSGPWFSFIRRSAFRFPSWF
jgi:hypothetical protein